MNKSFLKTLQTYVKLPPEIAVDFNSGDDDLIRRAAKLASGTSEVTQWNGDARSGVQPMLSIIDGNDNPDKYLPCRAMDITSLDAGDWVYSRTLWDAFIKEIQDLHNTVSDDKLFEESLVYTCQKYLSCVSINDATKDISLYHHIKMTAAIATCLKNNKNEVVLAGADFSGIQSFIYNLVSKNAAKNLKGRSFYLQLLIDSVIQKLLHKLDLGAWQMVYASGGKFYMLIPTSKKTDFKEEGKRIAEDIRKTHGLQIYLAIDACKFEADNLSDGKNMSDIWQGLSEKLGTQKRRRFADKLVDDFDKYFKKEGIEVGGESMRDVITNEEFTIEEQKQHDENVENGREKLYAPTKKLLYYLGEMDSNPVAALTQPVRALTFRQIELGKALRNATYWVSSLESISFSEESKIKKFEPCGLGVYHYFIPEGDFDKIIENETCRIIKFNNTILEMEREKMRAAFGFTFYGGNEFPKIKQEDVDSDETGELFNFMVDLPRTFTMLASAREPKRLGILRMDVDSLGQHFVGGIAEQDRNFSRYVALSNSLDYFFQGYLNTIWAKDEYREDTMIIYSGGDDLFIVGRWDKTIEIADEIQKKFREYVCENSKVTISGGVFLSPPKYPVMNAAKTAGDAEKKAKDYISITGKEKDAFAFLGNAMGWTSEYEFVKGCKDKFVEWHEELGDKFPNGLLQRIIGYAQSEKRYHEEKSKGNKPSPRWTWLMMYDLSKMAERHKRNNTDFYDFVIGIRDSAYIKDKTKYNQSNLQLYGIAARWAELYIRKNN